MLAPSPFRLVRGLFLGLLSAILSAAEPGVGFSHPPGMPYPADRPDDAWLPIRLPFVDPGPMAADLSSLVPRPAGAKGFVQVGADGHFRFADGERIRFWGVAVQQSGVMPSRPVAEGFASLMAKTGCNLVRFHIFDYIIEKDLAEEEAGTLGRPGRERLDAMDYLVSCLKRNGVYVYLDLNDTFVKMAKVDYGVDTWSEELITRQKDYARRLLGRRNPHTGLRYADDPVISQVEILNENSFWWNDNATTLREPWRSTLQWRWNRWLAERHPDPGALAERWARAGWALPAGASPVAGDVPLASVHANGDFARFAYDATLDYYRSMVAFLRGEVGVKVPITGHNCPLATPDLRAVAESTDFTSTHFYWSMGARAHLDTGIDDFWTLAPQLAASKVKGKPLLVTEFNFSHPNPYRAEGMPVLLAAALSQDVDGVIFFNYIAQSGGASFAKWPEAMWNFRFLPNDPTVWGQFAWGAQAFHRSYIEPLPEVAEVRYDEAETFATARRPRTLPPVDEAEWRIRGQQYAWRGEMALDPVGIGFLHAIFRSAERRWPYTLLPYLHRVERTFVADGEAGVALPGRPRVAPLPAADQVGLEPRTLVDSVHVSGLMGWLRNGGWEGAAPLLAQIDAGRMGPGSWLRHLDRPFLSFDAPCLQGGVGAWDERTPLALREVSLTVAAPWASVILCSLDGRPLASSARMLLTAVSNAVNSGQRPPGGKDWDVSDTGRGTGPILFNPVRLSLALAPGARRALAISAIDQGNWQAGAGRPWDGAPIQLADPTIQYLITER